jgi:hypothetical protein
MASLEPPALSGSGGVAEAKGNTGEAGDMRTSCAVGREGSDDIFDAVLNIDQQWYAKGAAEGTEIGRRRGVEEGAAVG